ncbi:MAG: hypothetical protein JO112_17825, partial [Planctomycetes bacterium]|nr:hypothetical protein [Planctomycetota bacterium]
GGIFVRLDAQGKEVKSFPVGQSNLGGFDILANGHLLVPQYPHGKIVEFDANGKSVAEINLPLPTAAFGLPNGHILTASQNNPSVLELDRHGKKVWEYQTEGRPWQVKRR